MNEVIEKELKIENMIYEIRGKQVMLDSDLSKLYNCTNGTKDINKAAGVTLLALAKTLDCEIEDLLEI